MIPYCHVLWSCPKTPENNSQAWLWAKFFLNSRKGKSGTQRQALLQCISFEVLTTLCFRQHCKTLCSKKLADVLLRKCTLYQLVNLSPEEIFSLSSLSFFLFRNNTTLGNLTMQHKYIISRLPRSLTIMIACSYWSPSLAVHCMKKDIQYLYSGAPKSESQRDRGPPEWHTLGQQSREGELKRYPG